MRKRNSSGGRMANMLRAMDAYSDRDNGGAAELARDEDRRCFDCGYMGCNDTGHTGHWTFRDDDDGHEITCTCDCHKPVGEPQCAITGCNEWPVTTCACCNRGVCADDILGAALDDLGICSDCAFTCAGGMACQVMSRQDTVTCHECGAPVEPDALARQTMADGALMWPEPFCRACLMAGLRRLDAELKRQPGKGEGDE